MLVSANVKKLRIEERRSGCPVSLSLEMFGDRWSLLIIRDMMVRGYRRFREFLNSGEGIATNILADRLERLQAWGIATAEVDSTDGRSVNYRLTEKGIDLAPVLLDLLLWGAKYEQTAAPCALMMQLAGSRAEVLAEVRRRWEQRDPAPLLPRFQNAAFPGRKDLRGLRVPGKKVRSAGKGHVTASSKQ